MRSDVELECQHVWTVWNETTGSILEHKHNVFDDAYNCGSGRNNYVGTISCTPLIVADNDQCSTAMTLIQNLDCQPITDSVANATQSLPGCSAGSTANDDVWFSFVATSADPIIEVAGSASFDAVVEIFDASHILFLHFILSIKGKI